MTFPSFPLPQNADPIQISASTILPMSDCNVLPQLQGPPDREVLAFCVRAAVGQIDAESSRRLPEVLRRTGLGVEAEAVYKDAQINAPPTGENLAACHQPQNQPW